MFSAFMMASYIAEKKMWQGNGETVEPELPPNTVFHLKKGMRVGMDLQE